MLITKTCLMCGKEFQVPHWRKDSAKYCSVECRQSALHGELNCTCEVCGKRFHIKESQLNRYKHHTCSKKCMNELKRTLYSGIGNHQYGLKGDLNASFKGKELTKINNDLVDIYVYCPDHPYANKNGRVVKHRLIVEQHYELFDFKYFEKVKGRVVLKKTTQIHHINEDHNDNRIENLIPVTRSEHKIIHNLFKDIVRDPKNGRITGVIKQGELLEKPEAANQQPSLDGNIFEGSETSSRVLIEDGNTAKSALPDLIGEDIVRPADITNETAELQDKEPVS